MHTSICGQPPPVKDLYNCDMGMCGTVKCRPTSAYRVHFDWTVYKILLQREIGPMLWTLNWYSSSTFFLEYQAGGGKGLVDLVNQLTLERCHSFWFYGSCRKRIPIRDSLMPKGILSQCGVSSKMFIFLLFHLQDTAHSSVYIVISSGVVVMCLLCVSHRV